MQCWSLLLHASNQVAREVVGGQEREKRKKRGACRNCQGFRIPNDPK